MARGDIKWFANWDLKAKTGVSFNLSADTLKVGIITNAQVPLVSTPDPRWGAGGSTDFSTAQVGVATAYTGPITLTGVTFTRTLGVNKLDHDDFTVAIDAAGFTNGYSLIYYNSTVAGNYAFAFADLGGPISIQAGPLNVNAPAGGPLTDTAA